MNNRDAIEKDIQYFKTALNALQTLKDIDYDIEMFVLNNRIRFDIDSEIESCKYYIELSKQNLLKLNNLT